MSVFGGKRLEPKNHEIVKLAIEGRNRGSKVNFEAVVVDEVCPLIPPDDVGKVAEQYDHLDGLELAGDGWMDLVEFSGLTFLSVLIITTRLLANRSYLQKGTNLSRWRLNLAMLYQEHITLRVIAVKRISPLTHFWTPVPNG